VKAKDALRVLAEITAYQWGMVTSAQAGMHGITRLDLSRLAADGQLERLAHGVYKDAGAPAGPYDDLKAAWLGTDPTKPGEARIKDLASGVVVAGASAAELHGIGDLRPLRHEFVSPGRRQSQRSAIRYRQRTLDPRDVTLVDGLPVMTMERTIADLTEEVGDLSLVADALRDASHKRDLNLERLRSLLAPLAQRNGLKNGDGAALLDRQMEIAGIDPDAVARRVAADASLGSRVTAGYLLALSADDREQFTMTPEMQQTMRSIQESLATAVRNSPEMQQAMRSIQESVAAVLRSSVAPQLADLDATMERVRAELLKSAGLDNVARQLSAQLVNGDVMEKILRGWATALAHDITLKPALLAPKVNQKAVTRD
jgi:hypothetical protein